ncbi:tyrosine--tRNA ligase [Prauserella marina]|uniref:Tyrosine--tRNA ligase n=1 Tax=Prauserella marina TaxID=530584 RepID=A0A222VT62_9PSEU|nr:tyrosine--tRNA ligase [Prauserella marina]ASR37098.1 tyrosine--tRNA ligase [Prauserella marina]PWV72403.1 tyrosyl-tRNA synthetase [Prauserella marina]SDD80817.1 tyrosyl-tRNA synthetase [Prauserella marina]
MSEHILDELTWRGLITQSTDLDVLRRDLDSGPIAVYIGFDPTAPSLHAGHLVQMLVLRRFQNAGHRPVLLAGGGTGLIGDPRDVGERTLNSEETVREWAENLRGQLAKFVDFDHESVPPVEVNNLDWLGQMTVPVFLRDVGKHFSVNTMLARETVRRRLDTDGMSYTEFSYMLLQATDYRELFARHGVKLQVGGSDQWGNIVAGVDLVRRVHGAQVHALTTPLVTDSEGRKLGKSTGGGNVWLDATMTSPYAWYQYFLNVPDADVVKYLKLMTFLGRDEIDELERETTERPSARLAQRKLAQELTDLVHGPDQTRQVVAASKALFGRGELAELDRSTLDAVMAEVPSGEVALSSEPSIVDLLIAGGLVDSKGAARRIVKEGGAYVNNTKITDEDWRPTAADALPGHWLVVRRGKRNLAGVLLRG